MHLIRTGSTFSGTERHYVGQDDPVLSDRGVDELRTLDDQLEYPEAAMVFTSPLRRCVQTAELLYPNRYTETDDNLKDLHLGSFQGYSYQQLEGDADFRRWLENSAKYPPPGGEGVQEFTHRLVEGVNAIFHRMMDEQLRQVAVVTHGGVIMTLLAAVCLPKQPLHNWAVGNGCGYTLLFTPQMWMRDGCAEVYAQIPGQPATDDDFFAG